ncbi:cation/H(+) antiporter 15-like [Iris pallida]|uniref:Cation/H(+) antiporter 15-like n=1 Tax=Iris pallida TaxID=29817 RepID=A0AAX6DNU3_IRIPA|nr:cation/H(+) antiporter 15-like [Iris pallida]KAJ6793431.1 cation/H(+) antiporter 15-like [Iris pallida]
MGNRGGNAGGRRSIQRLKGNAELRLLVCLHSEGPVPSVLGLLDLSCPGAGPGPATCVHVLHLVDLAGRASSSLVAHRNKKGFINPSEMARLHNAFISYEQDNRGRVSVQPYTSVAPFKTIHQDICSLAAEKAVLLVVVPFRRVTGTMGADDLALRTNISQILAQAPCSVGILVYPDDMAPTTPLVSGNYCPQIGVLFWGGPDDREALAYASRMALHGRVSLTVVHFVRPVDQRDAKQRQLDDSLLSKVRFENNNNEYVVVDEVLVRDMEQTIAVIRSLGNSYNLVIVGRKQGPNSLLDEGLADWSECPELGVVGDMLASKDFESSNSILVVQQRPRKGV